VICEARGTKFSFVSSIPTALDRLSPKLGFDEARLGHGAAKPAAPAAEVSNAWIG
jgi:hypothetical protein